MREKRRGKGRGIECRQRVRAQGLATITGVGKWVSALFFLFFFFYRDDEQAVVLCARGPKLLEHRHRAKQGRLAHERQPRARVVVVVVAPSPAATATAIAIIVRRSYLVDEVHFEPRAFYDDQMQGRVSAAAASRQAVGGDKAPSRWMIMPIVEPAGGRYSSGKKQQKREVDKPAREGMRNSSGLLSRGHVKVLRHFERLVKARCEL